MSKPKSKIKSNGKQSFNVPNTPEGLEFIRGLRQFSNKYFVIRVKGRGSRKEFAKSLGQTKVIGNAQSNITKEFASWFAVYISCETTYKYLSGIIENLSKQNRELEDAKDAEITILKIRLANAEEKALKASIPSPPPKIDRIEYEVALNEKVMQLEADLKQEKRDHAKLKYFSATSDSNLEECKKAIHSLRIENAELNKRLQVEQKASEQRISMPITNSTPIETDIVVRIPKGLKIQISTI